MGDGISGFWGAVNEWIGRSVSKVENNNNGSIEWVNKWFCGLLWYSPYSTKEKTPQRCQMGGYQWIWRCQLRLNRNTRERGRNNERSIEWRNKCVCYTSVCDWVKRVESLPMCQKGGTSSALILSINIYVFKILLSNINYILKILGCLSNILILAPEKHIFQFHA